MEEHLCLGWLLSEAAGAGDLLTSQQTRHQGSGSETVRLYPQGPPQMARFLLQACALKGTQPPSTAQ